MFVFCHAGAQTQGLAYAPPLTTFLAQKPSLFLTVLVLLLIYSLIYSFNLYFAYSPTISEEGRRNSPDGLDDDNVFSQDVLLSSQMFW